MRRIIAGILMGMLFLVGCGKEDALEKKLKSSEADVRLEAAKELGSMGTVRALNILTMYQDDKDFRVKQVIDESIKKINKQTFYK
jgi:HEAT repeat protein